MLTKFTQIYKILAKFTKFGKKRYLNVRFARHDTVLRSEDNRLGVLETFAIN
jgi:hypothetical protein